MNQYQRIYNIILNTPKLDEISGEKIDLALRSRLRKQLRTERKAKAEVKAGLHGKPTGWPDPAVVRYPRLASGHPTARTERAMSLNRPELGSNKSIWGSDQQRDRVGRAADKREKEGRLTKASLRTRIRNILGGP